MLLLRSQARFQQGAAAMACCFHQRTSRIRNKMGSIWLWTWDKSLLTAMREMLMLIVLMRMMSAGSSFAQHVARNNPKWNRNS